MAWPSTKASTTNVDSPTDSIKESRGDIKQNIDNTNAIIDTFDIVTPADKDVLEYNSTSGKFENVSGTGTRGSVILSFENTLTNSFGSIVDYTGTFNITGNNSIGIDVEGDSAGDNIITFPAGTYVIDMVKNHFSGVYGTSQKDEITTYWTENNGSTLFEGETFSTSFYHNVYTLTKVYTFASATEVYVRYNSNHTFEHPDIVITKIA